MRSTLLVKIRGYHIDAFAHLNHARYIRFMEEARWDYFDKHPKAAAALSEKGIAHATVHIGINYHHPVVLGDVIRIETGIIRKSRKSITFGQTIFINRSGRLASDAEVVNVFFNGQSGEVIETGSESFALWEDISEAPLVENRKSDVP